MDAPSHIGLFKFVVRYVFSFWLMKKLQVSLIRSNCSFCVLKQTNWQSEQSLYPSCYTCAHRGNTTVK